MQISSLDDLIDQNDLEIEFQSQEMSNVVLITEQ